MYLVHTPLCATHQKVINIIINKQNTKDHRHHKPRIVVKWAATDKPSIMNSNFFLNRRVSMTAKLTVRDRALIVVSVQSIRE